MLINLNFSPILMRTAAESILLSILENNGENYISPIMLFRAAQSRGYNGTQVSLLEIAGNLEKWGAIERLHGEKTYPPQYRISAKAKNK